LIKLDKDVALFGGSFDPPHLGHQEIVKRVLELNGVNRVIVMPTWLNPFKSKSFTPPAKRLEWSKRVFDMPNVIVSDYEIKKGRPVYTVESYRDLSRDYPIGYLVIGSDNLESITKWREFDKLNQNLTWIVATREGYKLDFSPLREYIELPLNIDISSSEIRQGFGLEYLDDKIQDEVKNIYKKESS